MSMRRRYTHHHATTPPPHHDTSRRMAARIELGKIVAADKAVRKVLAVQQEQLAVALAQLRGASIEVVEAICAWRSVLAKSHKTVTSGEQRIEFFRWEGQVS